MTVVPPAKPSAAALVVVVESIAELRTALVDAGRIAFVPTMGALHAGHLSLVEHAAGIADSVVVSIFVNPLQFSQSDDLERYPRTLEADIATLSTVDGGGEARGETTVIVFAPSVAELYPRWPVETKVVAGPVGSMLEGASRQGHFDGVLTIVAKLIGIVQPHTIVLGQKDAQQVFLVRRMVCDLNLPVEVDVAPTVRAGDGLALSSRNRFLDDDHKRAARALSHALRAASTSASASANGGVDAVLATAHALLSIEPLVKVDYLTVVDPSAFLPVDDAYRGSAVVLIAAQVGGVRLIDNAEIQLGG
jgi:pantoate--beta-alanine ligase